jgi:cytochrome c-type biogenesis protein CcmH
LLLCYRQALNFSLNLGIQEVFLGKIRESWDLVEYRPRLFEFMKKILSIMLFPYLLFTFSLSAQTTTTTTSLTDPNQIQEFLDATSRLRCICLPSLAIQSCSYNMCIVSSYLKTFIENQIKLGLSADEIVFKFENGFGDTILNDAVIQQFRDQGNERMIQNLVQGFGPNIQAKPDSTWINLSLAFIGILGLIGIGSYLVQRKKASPLNKVNPSELVSGSETVVSPNSNLENDIAKQEALTKKYLSEL